MLRYETLKQSPRTFLAHTGLTVDEFSKLLPVFERVYRRFYPIDKTMTGAQRGRAHGGGRRGKLGSFEQKLLFALVYQKTYPLQEVMASLFGMAQPRANEWIHRLLPVLEATLDELAMIPERESEQFSANQVVPTKTLVIDGTDRRRQRPKEAVAQTNHYSGRKKTHTDKNLVVVDAETSRVELLTPTYPGKIHDKKIADEELIAYPQGTVLYKDTGFQGYEPEVERTEQPKKSRATTSSRSRKRKPTE